MPIAVVIAGVIIAGAVIYVNPSIFSGGKEGEGAENEIENVLSSQDAADKALSFINENILEPGMTASLIEAIEENGLYKIKLKIEEKEFDSYVTKNGKFLFPQVIDLDQAVNNQQEEDNTVADIPKKDVPDIKLFIMSYCPYGLQAQKMFLPVYDLLKDKVDMEIYFVDYIMHDKQEIDENLRQYCIQKEQKARYYNYAVCFVKDGDFEKCFSEAKIDKARIDSCISETDNQYKIAEQYQDKSTWLNERYPKFGIHSELNEKYGVKGSPTVVINDEIAAINPRSPEHFKNIICEAFASQPEQCSQTLSDKVPSPGLGLGEGSSSGGVCE